MSDSDDDEGWGSADSDKYEPRYVLSFFLERCVKNVSKKISYLNQQWRVEIYDQSTT